MACEENSGGLGPLFFLQMLDSGVNLKPLWSLFLVALD